MQPKQHIKTSREHNDESASQSSIPDNRGHFSTRLCDLRHPVSEHAFNAGYRKSSHR